MKSIPTSVPNVNKLASVDAMGEALHCLRIDGLVYAQSYLSAPWGIAMPPMENCIMFHVITSGQCLVSLGEETIQLSQGDFILIPHGKGHDLKSGHASRVVNFFDLPIEHISPRFETVRYGGDGPMTTLVCGAVCCDHPGARELIEILPPYIHIDSMNTTHGEWMHSTLRLMAAEATHTRPGGEAVVTRLADILVIQAIRHWLENMPESKPSWITALQDEQIGKAILLMHKEPSIEWTLEELAHAVSMSRSAFASKFKALVNETPVQYLTRWRMYLAGDWLKDNNYSLMDCATNLGYRSEAAFTRAFKRVMGMPPGQWKKQQLELAKAKVA